ncbi:hypothetical protein RUND412_003977 [Rhizina undulata]
MSEPATAPTGPTAPPAPQDPVVAPSPAAELPAPEKPLVEAQPAQGELKPDPEKIIKEDEPVAFREQSPSTQLLSENTNYHSSSASEYEPEDETPPPRPKHVKGRKIIKIRSSGSGVISGRVGKSNTPATPGRTEKCPVNGCGQTFTGRNPRQSLWHHLKYYATRGLPDKVDFERAHGEAHALMKEESEPKGTPVERNRLSSTDYRKKNPEKAKTSARLSNFRARARKKGMTNEREIEEKVALWEKEWQEKQAKEASEYFSGILLSAFE